MTTVIYRIDNKAGGYHWEVREAQFGENYGEITLSFIDDDSPKYNQHNSMTKAEAVEIARAILKLAGEE